MNSIVLEYRTITHSTCPAKDIKQILSCTRHTKSETYAGTFDAAAAVELETVAHEMQRQMIATPNSTWTVSWTPILSKLLAKK